MSNLQQSLYQVSEIRILENLAIGKYGISGKTLMERAGKAVIYELKKRWPKAKNVVVICGKGNNGGDGYIAAYWAKKAGLAVKILQLDNVAKSSAETKQAYLKCQKLKIKIKPFVAAELTTGDLLIDAIFGTGFKGRIKKEIKQAINAINNSNIPVIAIDVPSGVDASSGNVKETAICAKLTVTFIGKKVGLFIGAARDYCGEIVVNDLSLPTEIISCGNEVAKILDLPEEKKLLPHRKKNAHKGDFGHVLVIGGDYGMGGAVKITAEAALRTGAGLVTVATRKEHVAMINATRPEIMVHGVESTNHLAKLLQKATVVVVGPGLGQDDWGKRLFNSVISADKPLILDGDALNILALKPKQKDNWILTPHPKEAARLLKDSVANIQANRLWALDRLIDNFGGVCVLKGSGTLVGNLERKKYLCDAGNPGMATAGMGDLLSGIIAGLLAQGLTLLDAANLGVSLHANAADLAAKQDGEVGMAALDLLPFVRALLR